MAKGTLPATAADFNTCVGWLANHDQQEALQALLSAPQCSKFDKLDLHGQAMSPEAVKCLARWLDRSSITALNLSGCQLGKGADDGKAIGELLKPGSPLTMLHLGDNDLGGQSDCFFHICEGLSANQTLKHLNLGYCGLNYEDCVSLLDVLSQQNVKGEHIQAQNTTLESLCLAGSRLTKEPGGGTVGVRVAGQHAGHQVAGPVGYGRPAIWRRHASTVCEFQPFAREAGSRRQLLLPLR